MGRCMTTCLKLAQPGEGSTEGGGATPQPPVGRMEEVMGIQEKDCDGVVDDAA